MNESKVQAKILKALKPIAKTIKIIQASRSGEADIVVCYKGKFLQLEVKAPNARQRKALQTRKLEVTREHKGYSFYIDDVNDLAKVLAYIDNKGKPKKAPLEAKNLKG